MQVGHLDQRSVECMCCELSYRKEFLQTETAETITILDETAMNALMDNCFQC